LIVKICYSPLPLKENMLNTAVTRILSIGLLVLLTACAGTVKREPGQFNKTYVTTGIASVQVKMTAEAQTLLADNPQFNANDLQGYIQRRLEGNGTFNAAASERVEVMVTGFRVRSAAAAILLGVLAGQDHMEGKVRVFSADGRRLHSFDVNASYGFGGAAGGDATRMGWMYEKFSELVMTELTGTTDASAVDKKNRAKPLPAGTPAPTALAIATKAVTSPDLFNIDALPSKSDRAKEIYRDWLTKKAPRAFVLAGEDGRNVFGTWGIPQNPEDPTDPTERALQRCLKAGHNNCKLYAVNNEIVWKPVAAEATAK
jgi:hypothetical protein